MSVMMRCGHVSQGRDGNGLPVCAIDIATPRDEDARTIVTDPDLTGRKSQCGSACKTVVDSSTDLPFFGLNPGHDGVTKFDTHYDGCRGWD